MSLQSSEDKRPDFTNQFAAFNERGERSVTTNHIAAELGS